MTIVCGCEGGSFGTIILVTVTATCYVCRVARVGGGEHTWCSERTRLMNSLKPRARATAWLLADTENGPKKGAAVDIQPIWFSSKINWFHLSFEAFVFLMMFESISYIRLFLVGFVVV